MTVFLIWLIKRHNNTIAPTVLDKNFYIKKYNLMNPLHEIKD